MTISAKLVVSFLVLALLAAVTFAGPGQMEPTKQRTLEIQHALVSHGYPVQVTGKWDAQTKAALFKIADERHWQVNRVPDAKVLILLDLGSPTANLHVAKLPGGYLDRAQRHEDSPK